MACVARPLHEEILFPRLFFPDGYVSSKMEVRRAAGWYSSNAYFDLAICIDARRTEYHLTKLFSATRSAASWLSRGRIYKVRQTPVLYLYAGASFAKDA